MSYKTETRERAISLRRKGYSIKEIADTLKIAKSTSSGWSREVVLTPTGKARLKKRKIFGQYKARETLFRRGTLQQAQLLKQSSDMLSKVTYSKDLSKLCCALIYYCEGNKDSSTVRFTNSDPTLIKLFIQLLKYGFSLDKSKFRCLVHIHEYHDEDKQKAFWSGVTGIPLSQFHRSYQKPNTGKRKHADYPGCLSLSYYDSRIAKELLAIYSSFVLRGFD